MKDIQMNIKAMEEKKNLKSKPVFTFSETKHTYNQIGKSTAPLIDTNLY